MSFEYLLIRERAQGVARRQQAFREMEQMAIRPLVATLSEVAQIGSLAGDFAGHGSGPAADAEDRAECWYEGAWAHAGVEPSLEDLLRDPMIHLVMRADRWEPAQVRRWLGA
jgi:hypothetical protein